MFLFENISRKSINSYGLLTGWKAVQESLIDKTVIRLVESADRERICMHKEERKSGVIIRKVRSSSYTSRKNLDKSSLIYKNRLRSCAKEKLFEGLLKEQKTLQIAFMKSLSSWNSAAGLIRCQYSSKGSPICFIGNELTLRRPFEEPPGSWPPVSGHLNLNKAS